MMELRLPDRVGIVDTFGEDAVYIARLPDGPIVVLRATALAVWREAVWPSSEQELAERVASLYGLSAHEVRADVDACVHQLIARRVLEVAPGR